MSRYFWAAALSRQDATPADGIHLLWSAPATAGYSARGYDVQRRVSAGKPAVDCYPLTPDELAALHAIMWLTCPPGTVAVRTTECPRPVGDPPDDPVDGGGAGTRTCVDFAALTADPPTVVDTIDGLSITAYEPGGVPRPHVVVRDMGGARGTDCGFALEITLPAPAGRAELTLVSFAQPARVTAYSADGKAVASAVMHVGHTAETLTLTAAGIVRVRVEPPNDETLLQKFCWTSDFECLALDGLEPGTYPNPLPAPMAALQVLDLNGTPEPSVTVRRMGAATGLDCSRQVRAWPSRPVGDVRVTLVTFAGPATVNAVDRTGAVVGTATSRAHGRPETLTLSARGAVTVEIVAPQGETLLLQLCVAPPGPDRLARAAAAPMISAHGQGCLRYDVRFSTPHRFAQITAQAPAVLAVAMHEGKTVGSAFRDDPGGTQVISFEGRSADEIVFYTGQPVNGLTICVDTTTQTDEDAEWSTVPYLVKGLQLPVRAVNSALAGPDDELALARSRLLAGEALDAAVFTDVAATMNAVGSAGPAAPVWFTERVRRRAQDPFVELQSWSYGLAMTIDAAWRRALGFGFLDQGAGLTAGTSYDYRVTGHFLRRDVGERLLGFHTIPSGTRLPATFHLGPVRLSAAETTVVELYPPLPDAALAGTARRGIPIPPGLTVAFDTPVRRAVLELEPARTSTLDITGRTPSYLFGQGGTEYPRSVPGDARVVVDFPEPVDVLKIGGAGFLYGIRLVSPTDDPADVLIDTVVLLGVRYEPTAAPAPPPSLGTTNLQTPIIPGAEPSAPHALGFRLRWSPPPVGPAPALWPVDLGAGPPTDVASFLLERRRVDTGAPYKPVGERNPPTLFHGNRGGHADPVAIRFGGDVLEAFPEAPAAGPAGLWVTVDDVLRSAQNAAGPPPGSRHQYRVYSVDAIGRRSATPAEGSVVRLEKHVAPPTPPGPEAPAPAGVVRPAGVRARVLQATDPDLPADDIALLGASTNAIVLEWGWTAAERASDPFATEFRIYWRSSVPADVGAADLRPGAWEERTAVIPMTAGPADPAPYVFRDRLLLDADHPIVRVCVGVSSADAQPYVADEWPATRPNGGRPGNESSVAPVIADARYLGCPGFVVPAPLADVPEDVTAEPVGPTVEPAIDLPALLPTVVVPPGHRVVVDRFPLSVLSAAVSQPVDGTIGMRFPDDTTSSYTLGNPADQAAFRAQIATGEPARVENRFLVDALLRYPDRFAASWERALPDPLGFAAVTVTLPAKPDRWLFRVRLADVAGHLSAEAALVPRVLRVASNRAPGPPALTVADSTTDTVAVTGRLRAAADLKWLVLFTLAASDTDLVDERTRRRPQLLRTPDRRDLYPMDGLRLRLIDGTLLAPATALDVVAVGTPDAPDVLVDGVITPGHAMLVSVWAVSLTRDGIPSRLSGPATARTGPAPLAAPTLTVQASAGTDTLAWPLVTAPAEISVERSADGGVTWARVSPWLPGTATNWSTPGAGARRYRLALRGTRGQPVVTGDGVPV